MQIVKPDIAALTKQVSEGLASQEELGVALKTIQVSLGIQVINGLEELSSSMSRLNDLINRSLTKYDEVVTNMINSDTITYDQLGEMITTLQKNQVAFLDLQRKIVQSPNKLFPEDTASAEERQLLELVKSFKTIEEKQKFFNIVEQAYNQTKCTQA